MERSVIEKRLAQTEKHVARGEEMLATQREVIERIRGIGHDTAAAEQTLADLEQAQTVHIAERDQLREKLGAGRRASGQSHASDEEPRPGSFLLR